MSKDRLGSEQHIVTVVVDDERKTSAVLIAPDDAVACYVLAHGAGAGMHHPLMAAVAHGLGRRGVATLRYQFPFMEAGSRRPDPPRLAHATVRAAVVLAATQTPGLPLFAGGRSFGGRMTSQAEADTPLPDIQGLIFLGFPLHAAKKPSTGRADHLSKIRRPMLFVQGDRDALADMVLLKPILSELGSPLVLIAGGDHSFHVPARLHRTDREVLDDALDQVHAWISSVVEKK